jgi:hypothetical protein
MSISNTVFVEVEDHPAWHRDLGLSEVELLLVQQKPFTYILSGRDPNDYYLSYLKRNSQVVHIHFAKISFLRKGRWVEGYRNITTINFLTLESFIRYKIKGKGTLPAPCLLKLSA